MVSNLDLKTRQDQTYLGTLVLQSIFIAYIFLLDGESKDENLKAKIDHLALTTSS